MTKKTKQKSLKPLLLDRKQIRELLGIASFRYFDDFPKPVYLGNFARTLWKRKDVERWVKRLNTR